MYFIKIIGSLRTTAQWQYESSLKICITSENICLSLKEKKERFKKKKKKKRSRENDQVTQLYKNSKFLWENEIVIETSLLKLQTGL